MAWETVLLTLLRNSPERLEQLQRITKRGHTTEDYRTLRNHLEQLVREGRLKQFLH